MLFNKTIIFAEASKPNRRQNRPEFVGKFLDPGRVAKQKATSYKNNDNPNAEYLHVLQSAFLIPRLFGIHL